MQKHGVYQSSCAPYDPKGNGKRERSWQTQANDTTKALHAAKLPDAFWWYAWRDAERKSYCIPRKYADGTWSVPWLKAIGRRPNALVEV